ncbi:uncharacterized protein LOC111631627 [Centruroides sculpturatus]|uniref:uncharacterized protein LOC111631627 n=1 Tax=Centruroides sculpturatus TaxID=218467 RepID=UPI000C6D435F|nr:uncharacterized protein LOC111631627 [Centruroides sculpturatus]XP_023231692.1 uncharacterized protein LOC111631627 [Centruroides sculpturatus]XP_023231701.1 uncharacterized protein LOC111631627 [Centruroides sculpturatus]
MNIISLVGMFGIILLITLIITSNINCIEIEGDFSGSGYPEREETIDSLFENVYRRYKNRTACSRAPIFPLHRLIITTLMQREVNSKVAQWWRNNPKCSDWYDTIERSCNVRLTDTVLC